MGYYKPHYDIRHPKSSILFVGYMVIEIKIQVLRYAVCLACHIL